MPVDGKIRLAVLLDYRSGARLIFQLISQLRDTGEVEPCVIQCRDGVEYPEHHFPLFQFHNTSPKRPSLSYDLEDITGYTRFLFESGEEAGMDGYFDETALAMCAQAEEFFSEHPVDCVLLWGGTHLILRAVAAASRAAKVPVVILETPYFQELPEAPEQEVTITLQKLRNKTFIWDTVQAPQCGPSQLTANWDKAPAQPGLHAFLDRLRENRISKYSQKDIQGNRTARGIDDAEPVQPEAELFKPPNSRVLLVLGQIDRDSSMFFNQGLVSTWHDLGRQTATRLPPGWIMWFKGHPLDTKFTRNCKAFAQTLHDINPRCRMLPPTMDIHACYQACDAVACINSTSTIEASLYELPVINLGRGAFTHIGMSYALSGLEEIDEILEELPERMTPEQLAIRDRFLSYVLYDYLIPVGSPRKMLERIKEAIEQNS